MRKLRWAMDGDVWELDASTPSTLEGTARAVPGDPLPLGLSRGSRLSRPKQIDFVQRFMAAPFLPSYTSALGLTFHRVLTVPFTYNWFTTLLGQFNVNPFVSSVKQSGIMRLPFSSRLRSIGQLLRDKSLYALGFSSELLLTPDDTLLVSLDSYAHNNTRRSKAVFHHEFPHHNLTVEAVAPALFLDKSGSYWDVPFSLAVDLASVASDSGPSYHLCAHHSHGSPELVGCDQTAQAPATLLPGLAVKGAFSYRKNIDFWKSKASKLKMVQPYDIFLSNPHVSASGIIGAAITASFGDNSVRSKIEDNGQGFSGFSFHAPTLKSSILGDMFASISLTVQHGNFQRRFADLTRFQAWLDIPSGSKFLSSSARLAQELSNSQKPSLEALNGMCPKATVSLQQQIAGPFSVRVESGVAIDFSEKDWRIHTDKQVFAIEYALQVLCSAKAVAWYSPKHREFMVELRFYES